MSPESVRSQGFSVKFEGILLRTISNAQHLSIRISLKETGKAGTDWEKEKNNRMRGNVATAIFHVAHT